MKTRKVRASRAKVRATRVNIRAQTKKARTKRKKIVRVLAQGTFDVLHPGHVHYLTYAKEQGTYLIVIVARDVNVYKFKGKKPVCDETMRLQMVQSLKMVDKAVLGGKGNILDRVVKLKPHVIVLGYDQEVSESHLKERLSSHGLRCRVIRAKPFRPFRYKSALIKKRIGQSFQKTST
jgi:FAD synthetase